MKRAIIAGALTLAIPLLMTASGVHLASAATVFRAVASASTITGQFSNPDQLPLGATLEASGPTAQATIDQLGTSKAFASQPYPGDFMVGVPGLLNGAGSPVPVPDYPFYVSSDRETQPEAKAEGPGYSLSALSDEAKSTGDAVGAVAADLSTGRAAATATTSVAADGAITATARAVVESVVVQDVLRFGVVRSEVTVTRGADGKITPTSSFSVDGVSVAGQAVGIVDGELVVAGTKQPLPNPLADVLADAGVTLSQTSAQDTADGRTGGTLVVTVIDKRAETGTSTATYRIGTVAAFVAATEIPGSPLGSGEDSGPATPPFTGDAAAPETAQSDTAFPEVEPAPAAMDLGGEVAAAPPVAAPPQGAEQAVPRRSSFLPERGDGAWLWIPFIVAGMALLGSASLLRQLGVKARL